MSALTIREMADIARRMDSFPCPSIWNLKAWRRSCGAADRNHTADKPLASRISSARAHRCGLSSMWPNAMDSLCLKIARKHSTGPECTATPNTDAAMFSFGSIKTAPRLPAPWYVCAIQDWLEKVQPFRKHILNSRQRIFRELLTHVCVKLFTMRFSWTLSSCVPCAR